MPGSVMVAVIVMVTSRRGRAEQLELSKALGVSTSALIETEEFLDIRDALEASCWFVARTRVQAPPARTRCRALFPCGPGDSSMQNFADVPRSFGIGSSQRARTAAARAVAG